jgi:hypothetical protein
MVRRISTRVYEATIVSVDNLLASVETVTVMGMGLDFDLFLDDCAKGSMEDVVVWSRMFSRQW